jgi:hypothetical protein
LAAQSTPCTSKSGGPDRSASRITRTFRILPTTTGLRSTATPTGRPLPAQEHRAKGRLRPTSMASFARVVVDLVGQPVAAGTALGKDRADESVEPGLPVLTT